MQTYLRKRIAVAGAAMIAALALVAAACGGDDDGDAGPRDGAAATPTIQTGGGVPSSGSVAPNTFLTFEGKAYRLVDLLQADLVEGGDFEEIGEATDADIDQEDLTVYRKADDADAVYTFAAETPGDDDAPGAPALWYRWTAEP